MFVIRIWSETDRAIRNAWRASVTHVASGQRQYFTNYGELCAFLEHRRHEPASVRPSFGGAPPEFDAS
jgi:hypothetical protein